MLPQPPSDAPAPPASEQASRSRRKWRWIWIVGLFSMTGLLCAPLVTQSAKKSNQTEAVNNARQIGLSLFEFQSQYGKFPDATTIAAVKGASGTRLLLGMKTSNDFFRQLMASGTALSETTFYAKISGTRKPDGKVAGSLAVAKGECGFTYLLGASSVSNLNRPIVVSPMIPGTNRFDPKPFEGKAVILKLDNSVTSVDIDKHGHALLSGRNLMDPHHPV